MGLSKQQWLDIASVAGSAAVEILNKNKSNDKTKATSEEDPSLFTGKPTEDNVEPSQLPAENKDKTEKPAENADTKPTEKPEKGSFLKTLGKAIWSFAKKIVPALVDKYSDKENLERNRTLADSAIQLGDYAIDKANQRSAKKAQEAKEAKEAEAAPEAKTDDDTQAA